jgi:hypothetical protein
MEEALGAEEPDALFWARLLAEFLEIVRRRMPPVVRDFIKLYAQALRNGAGAAGFLGCKRYEMLRAQGASHELAVSTLGMDPNFAQWCRLRYLLKNLPLPQDPAPGEPDGIPGAPAEVPDVKADESTPPPNTRLWADEDHVCCSGGGDQTDVALDWGTLRITPAVAAGDTRRISGAVTVSHPCGILFARLQIFIGFYTVGEPIDFFADIPSHDVPNFLKVTRTANAWTFELDNVGLSRIESDWLQITAVSRCYTTLPPGEGERIL